MTWPRNSTLRGVLLRVMAVFDETAKKWIDELHSKGKLKGQNQAALKQLAVDYAGRLEKIFYEKVAKQLEIFGKVEEFERMMLYDSQYVSKYLNQTIPGYAGFKMDVFNKAKKIIIDNEKRNLGLEGDFPEKELQREEPGITGCK